MASKQQGQAWAVLSLRDDGPGIAREHLPHLFERFYRVDQTRTHSQKLSPDTVVLAIAARADSSAGTYILLGVALFAALIAVVNIAFNRKT